MLKKLRDILNSYTPEELEDMDIWIDSKNVVDKIIIEEYSIDLISKKEYFKSKNNEK